MATNRRDAREKRPLGGTRAPLRFARRRIAPRYRYGKIRYGPYEKVRQPVYRPGSERQRGEHRAYITGGMSGFNRFAGRKKERRRGEDTLRPRKALAKSRGDYAAIGRPTAPPC